MTTNPQLELAHDYVCNTDKNIFLTGKAGTGKTTFLHRMKTEVPKRMAVVAPTGVAAINAGGMTIHSLFQLPFGPQVPGQVQADNHRRFNKEKISLLKCLDLLVIDEISMVRADLLDAIDGVLRRYRGSSQPFGGVQLLMIGDLNQLPPVVKPDEWELLRQHYQTPYFFGSLALQKSDPVTIELKQIFRQSDERFIELLNKVRDNQLDQEVLAALNSRFQADFAPLPEEGFITLTALNAESQQINQQRLAAIGGVARQFKAKIEDDFPVHAYPTDELLDLKTGAQVMFIKNDPNPEKLFFNGKIGQVTRMEDEVVYVKCPDDPQEISVTALTWENVKYSLNEGTKEVDGQVVGTFRQYPLKLAWAITIHKSQGLTFERAIIDAQAAFAHGQVYVALSRCKSFEGLVLRSKISFASVKTDTVVKQYNEETERNAPNDADLEASKLAYQQKLLLELFDFQGLRQKADLLNRVFLEHPGSLPGSSSGHLHELVQHIETLIWAVAQKFKSQLLAFFQTPILPEANPDLQARVQAASKYFLDNIATVISPSANGITIATDNQAVGKKLEERREELLKEIFVKNACLKASAEGFTTPAHIRAKADADLNFAAQKATSAARTKPSTLPPDAPHPALVSQLIKWRDKTALDEDKNTYEVLALRSLLEIVQQLPTSDASLEKIKGFGDYKIGRYGSQIVGMVTQYCRDNSIPTSQLDLPPVLLSDDTKRISFDLLQSGKTIDEVAAQRCMVRSTIEGHLTYFIERGELDVAKVLVPEKVKEIADFLRKMDTPGTTAAKEFFGEKYSYGEIRMVLKSLTK